MSFLVENKFRLAAYLRIAVYKVVLAFYTGSLLIPPKDNLSATTWWQLAVRRQARMTKGRRYETCLFGDSISAQLGNSLGQQTFNFALGGMSTVSLCEQLKILLRNQVKCVKAVIAVGANDAWYGIDDDLFVRKIREVIALIRAMGAIEIILIPAFYSTVSASSNPFLAASISRVEEINALLNQVAAMEEISIAAAEIQVLFEERALRESFTKDGVHLNPEGLDAYRQALLKLLRT